AVLTALAKLPADRYATPADFAAALTTQPTSSTQWTAPARKRSRLRDPVVAVLGAAAIFLGIATAVLATRDDRADAFPMRSVISLDSGGPIGTGALSPDGRSVVYA